MTKTSSLSHWRNYANNYRLCAKKCVACDKIYFPKKRLCLCGGQEFENVQLSGRGKLLTFTQVINPTREFVGTTPYCLGIIELDEGIKVLGQLADTELQDLSIGMPVQAVFRKMYEDGEAGVINYGFKFLRV